MGKRSVWQIQKSESEVDYVHIFGVKRDHLFSTYPGRTTLFIIGFILFIRNFTSCNISSTTWFCLVVTSLHYTAFCNHHHHAPIYLNFSFTNTIRMFAGRPCLYILGLPMGFFSPPKDNSTCCYIYGPN